MLELLLSAGAVYSECRGDGKGERVARSHGRQWRGGRVGAGQATHSNEEERQVDVKMTRSCPAEKLCPLPAPSLTLPWRSGGNS